VKVELNPEPLLGRGALVTGAGRGIGRAIARRLAELGATVLCVSRSRSELDEVVRSSNGRAVAFAMDISAEGAAAAMLDALQAHVSSIDILVNCAGILTLGTMETMNLAALDRAFTINVRSPYVLTQAALPGLKRSHGQVLFVNSSILRATNTAGRGVHAAAQAALKAFADSLRDEVNGYGIRVLSIMPGRTATAREQQRCATEGRPYRPELLLQPEDVAEVACNALLMPRTAETTDLFMRPMVNPNLLTPGNEHRAS
jgi:NAD(P)-dependent dehydrogenase (short-subunit alcohol dehydrogenase family)